MNRFAAILFLFSTAALRADLTLEQQSIDANRTNLVTIQLHGDKMRVDQPDLNLSIIVDLKTRDSFTLLTKLKQFLQRYGSEVRWQMDEEKKYTSGTNDMDAPPTPAMDTGKSVTLNEYDAEIYTWSGAHGQTETLWVAGQYPDYKAIRAELYKLDRFNDSGPHRNAQPILSVLPGMVVKTEGEVRGHKMTTTLVSATLKPLDESLFELPIDYTPWKHPDKETNETNLPPTR